jgi:hypothetical protein
MKGSWLAGLVLSAALLAPALVCADPPCAAGDGHGRRDCPRSEYSRLHYWAPSLYKARACLFPSNLDQAPPGLGPDFPAPVEVNKYKCRANPPQPSSPYADPAGYFGRPIAPPLP